MVKSAIWLSITTVGLNQVYAYKKKIVYCSIANESNINHDLSSMPKSIIGINGEVNI